jgi:hypothetical protein
MSRVNVRVRPATEADIPALVALVQTIDTSTGMFSGRPLQDQSTQHLTERFTEILRSDRVLLIAADESGGVVGMLSARDDAVGAIDLTPVLHVTHLMVAPGHRRRGMTDVAGRMAVLRRARMIRAQRGSFTSRAVGRGA